MSSLLALTAGTWGTALALGVIEARIMESHRRRIPHRLMVSGVRGKTLLTRLLHSGYTAMNVPCGGRISGDAPIFILPDGSEEPVNRWGPAHIREMRRALRRMVRAQVQAAVIENMAIDFELQEAVSKRILRPTVALVVSDATDHLETWPIDPAERAKLLLRTISPDIPLILAPLPPNEILHRLAVEQRRRVVWPDFVAPDVLPDRGAALAAAAIAALEHTHPGTDKAAARERIISLASTRAALSVIKVGDAYVLDLLSANDPDSTRILLEEAESLASRHGVSRVEIIYNHRTDRPARLASFLSLFAEKPSRLIGEPVPWSCRRLFPSVAASNPHDAMTLFKRAGARGTLFALTGNSGGIGMDLRELLAREGEKITW